MLPVENCHIIIQSHWNGIIISRNIKNGEKKNIFMNHKTPWPIVGAIAKIQFSSSGYSTSDEYLIINN